MKLNKKNAAFLNDSLTHWNKEGLLDEAQIKRLSDDIEIVPFDWRRVAKYSMWISIICIVTAVGSVFADEALIEFFKNLLDASRIIKLIGFTFISTVLYFWAYKRKNKFPEKIYSNEVILFLGVLATASALLQLGMALSDGSGHFSILLLISFIIYGFIGFFLNSNLVWLFSLLSLGSWYGAETGYISGASTYFLGMNYPLRFVLFGAIIVGVTLALEKHPRFSHFFRSSLAMGLLYLFIALWILSIYGNHENAQMWREVNQYQLLYWSALFAIFAGASIYHGVRFENGMTKGFGITFLFINFYTRYFEFFWDGLHKAAFFTVLGITFWLIGNKAEKIWNVGKTK